MCDIVNTTKKLNQICKQILDETSRIAIDTEFIRKNSYFPEICLIQVAFTDKKNKLIIILIDPLSEKMNLKKFFQILNSNKINKIFYSATQDFDALHFLNKRVKINNFDDVQMMLEFCNQGCNLSYANIVKFLLDIVIEKDKNIQISNWKKRPLTKKQINYVGDDVRYLFELYDILVVRLINYDNYEYYIDEIENFEKKKNTNYLIKNAWKKMKIDLHKKPLHVVKAVKKITELREKIAIKNNLIRSLIVEDKKIETLILNNNLDEAKKIILNNEFLNKHESYILDILKLTKNKNSKILFYIKENGFINKKEFTEIQEKIEKFSIKKQINITRLLTKFDIICILMGYCKKEDILYGWKYENFNNFFEKTIKFE